MLGAESLVPIGSAAGQARPRPRPAKGDDEDLVDAPVRGADVERGRLVGPNVAEAATAAATSMPEADADTADPIVNASDLSGESVVVGAGIAALSPSSCGDRAPKCAVEGAEEGTSEGSENNDAPLPLLPAIAAQEQLRLITCKLAQPATGSLTQGARARLGSFSVRAEMLNSMHQRLIPRHADS